MRGKVAPPLESNAGEKWTLSSLLAIHEEQRKAARQSNRSYDRRQRQSVGSLCGDVQRPYVDNIVSTGIGDALIGEGNDSYCN